MVSTKSERATIYNAFGIIRGSIEPGNAIYAAMADPGSFVRGSPTLIMLLFYI